MPVYSMTGYANGQSDAAAQAANAGRLSIEIRSVNSRFLDLAFKFPDELRHHEPQLRELLTRCFKRGKVEVRASVEAQGSAGLAEPSARLLQRLNGVQDAIKAWLPRSAELSIADVLRLAANEAGRPQQAEFDMVGAVERVAGDLLAARAREGERLVAMLRERLGSLRAFARQAAPIVPQLVDQQRKRFLERWQEAMGLAGVAPDAVQDRALSEATAFAIRIDVAEELTRLSAHLDEIERLLDQGGEIGKRLDFLIQELHREANTLGAKSAALELTRIGVDMKVVIEQMREQVQNIE